MNTKRSNNSNRIKNFGLAACAVMALGVLTAGEAAAQCRIGGNPGYGYNTGSRGIGNGYNYGSNFNNRLNTGYGYNAHLGYDNYSRGPSSLSFGLNYNSNRGYNNGFGGWGTGGYGNRSNFGNGFYGNSRQPVTYRHGNHIDVEDGHQRIHLRGRRY